MQRIFGNKIRKQNRQCYWVHFSTHCLDFLQNLGLSILSFVKRLCKCTSSNWRMAHDILWVQISLINGICTLLFAFILDFLLDESWSQHFNKKENDQCTWKNPKLITLYYFCFISLIFLVNNLLLKKQKINIAQHIFKLRLIKNWIKLLIF